MVQKRYLLDGFYLIPFLCASIAPKRNQVKSVNKIIISFWIRTWTWIWMLIAKLLVDIAAMRCARLQARYSRQLAPEEWQRSQQGDGVWQ